MADCKICGQHVNLFDAFYYKGKPVHYECGQKELKKKSGECEFCGENVDNKSKHMQQFHEAMMGYERIVDDFINSSDNNGVSLSGISKSWWDNNANPSQKANILNKTGSPVENTLNLPSYDELSQQTKTYLDTRNDFSFENKANEDHWDEIEKETGKLDGKGKLNWVDNRMNQLHKQDPRTYDEWIADRNYELGFEESYAGESETFTCSFCGKVGTSFSTMAQEECPQNSGGGHQIPIFGDMKKSGEAGGKRDKAVMKARREGYSEDEIKTMYPSEEAGLYGYGSATGRMSPAESWNQMYLGGDVYTGARKVSDQAMGIMREYEGFKWDQLPSDIQELWKSMGDYMPSGEAKYDKDHKYNYKSWTENPDGTVNVNDKDSEQIQALMDELGESWDFKNNEERWTTFEKIGFKSNEAIVMANLNWSDLSLPIKAKICEVQDSDKEAKREEDKLAFNNAGEQPDTTTDQDIDYNQIFENTLIRTKYECEHCNAGFKSNENLMTHFNDTHARETDGKGCLYCKENIAPENMVEHLAYEHAFIAGESKKKAREDWDVTSLDNHYLNSFRKIGEDYYECKYCGKDGFYPDEDEAEMKAHIKKHEGGEALANEDDMDDEIMKKQKSDRTVTMTAKQFRDSLKSEELAKVSLENFTGKCPECNTYYEDTVDEYCLNCGASFDENDNVSESYEENDLECPECNSSKIHKNRGKGDSRFGQGEYACNNCGATFDSSNEADDDDRYADDGYGERKIDTGSPMFDNGSESHVWGDWFDSNFKEEYTMDQDGAYRCKHCDAWFDMYGTYGSFTPQEVAKHHLKKEHGIGEANPNHANDGKFTSGNDKTDYSEKKDVYFKHKDGKIEKKSMSLRQYKKASKTHDGSSGWGQGGIARDLEREYNKQNEAKESVWDVHTIPRGTISVTLGDKASEEDAINAVKRMHFGQDGYMDERDILNAIKVGEAKPKERNLSDIIDQVNNNNTPEDGWNDEDKVGEGGKYSSTGFDKFGGYKKEEDQFLDEDTIDESKKLAREWIDIDNEYESFMRRGDKSGNDWINHAVDLGFDRETANKHHMDSVLKAFTPDEIKKYDLGYHTFHEGYHYNPETMNYEED